MRRIKYHAGLIVRANTLSQTTRPALVVYRHKQGPFGNCYALGYGRTKPVFTQFSRPLHHISSDQSEFSWEERLKEYQVLLGRCWSKASSIKRDGEAKDKLAQDEMSILEQEFYDMTECLLHDLELLPLTPDAKEDDKKHKEPLPTIPYPRINVGDIFNILSVNDNLRPLNVNLHELMSLLENNFGPYKVVRKLAGRTRLRSSTKDSWPRADPSETGTSSAVYRILTAYLFYTSLTPQDIRGILSTPSVIDGMSEIDDGLIKEYFSFLFLYLEMCEADDDLRFKYPKTKKGLKEALIIQEDSEDFFSRQSRRVLLGRLKSSLFLYNLNGGFGPQRPLTFINGLTVEQREIVELDLAVGEVLRVKAFAGTGKTTVLTEYAKARPEEKWLFLTFNNSVQKDAERKFGPNVHCQTIHSLARETVLKMRQKLKAPESSENNLTRYIIDILTLNDKEILKTALLDPLKKPHPPSKVARVINETLLTFFTSAEVEIDYASLHWMMADKLELKKDVILEWARKVWDELQKLEGPCCPHDGYLKMMHLDGVGASNKKGLRCKADTLAFSQYDGIMFDEAQDADSVMAEIIFRQRPFSRLIVVGDPNQMIYEFRGTNNECFDEDIYPVTHNKSLTYSFRFGLGIAAAATLCLRAISEPLTMRAIGDVDVLKADFPKVTELVDPLKLPTTIYDLPPGSSSDGGSGKHVVLCRKNSSLVSVLFSYCHSHPKHKVYIKVPSHMEPRTLFSLLKDAYRLKQGNPSDSGSLGGLRSMEALVGKVLSETSINAGAPKRCRLLYEEAEKELKALGIEVPLKKMTQIYKLKRQDKHQIQQLLKGNPPPKVEKFLQALISRDVITRMFPPELKLIAGLERQNLFSDPSFLEKIDFCSERVVDNAEHADVILSTAHQAKGLEWDNVVMADDFAALHIHRHSSGVRNSELEGVRIMYVASTRARKELHIAQNMRASMVSQSGSYRWYLSPMKGECPICRDGRTCGILIGYETVMETARFGSNLVIHKTGEFPFGDREGVIGCHRCIVDFYKPLLRDVGDSYRQPEYESIMELERFMDILGTVMDGNLGTQDVVTCEPQIKRGGWLRNFEDMNAADEIRVGSWMRKHILYSWGVLFQQARMRRSN